MVQKKTVTRFKEQAESIINTVREPLISLDQDLRVVSASRSFYEVFKVKPEETVGQLIYDLGNKQWDIPKLRELLEDILPQKTTFDNYEVVHNFTSIGRRIMLLNARQIEREMGKERIILLAIEDITERRRLQEESEANEKRNLRAFESSQHGLLLVDRSHGDILNSNPYAQELLGYSKEEFLKNKLWGIGVVKDDKDFQEALSRLERDGVIYYDNIPVKNKKGLVVNTEVILVDKVKFIQCSIRDITEHKRAEETIRALVLRQEAILSAIPDIIMEVNDNKTYTWANQAGREFFGEDVVGREASYYFEGPKDIYNFVDPLFKGDEKIVCVDSWQRRKDGEKRLLAWTCSLLKDTRGNVGALSSARDITERKQSEKQINLLAHTLKSVAECVSITDLNDIIIFVNNAFLKTYCYSEREILGKNINIVRSPNNPPEATRGILAATLAGGWSGELMNRTKNGRDFPVCLSTSFVRDEQGQDIALVGIATDITERKVAEEELKKNEEKYRSIFENVQDVYYELSLDGIVLEVSPSIEFISKGQYHREDFVGRSMLDIYSDIKDHDTFMAELRETGRVTDLDVQLKNKDGSFIFCSFSAKIHFDAQNKPEKIIGSVHDISERKRIENALATSEIKYRAFFENSMDAILLTVPDGRILSANQAACRIFGYSEEELISTGKTGIVDLKDPKLVELLSERELYGNAQGELTFIRKDGTHFPADISSAIFKGNKGEMRASMIIRDITERKRVVEELNFAHNELKNLHDTLEEAIFSFDMVNNKMLKVSAAHEAVYGYPANEFMKNPRLWYERVLPEDRPIVDAGFVVLRSGKNHQHEVRIVHVDGHVRWIEAKMKPTLDQNGRLIHIDGIVTNITERKRAEEVLRETSDYLENLLSFANAPIMVWDNKNKITKFNLAFERMTGYTMYDVLGKNPEILFSDDKREEILALISSTSDGENLISVELPVRCKNGITRIVLWNTSNIYTKDGKTIIATIAHGQDVTERKRAEEELRKSEQKFRSIFENVQDVYYETSFDGTVLEISPSVEIVSMGQYKRADLIGKSMFEFYTDANDRNTILGAMKKIGNVNDFEVRLKNQDGSFVPCSISAKMIFNAQGRPEKIVGSMHDITERKRAEKMIQESELRYRSLYENATIGIYRSTPDGSILLANPALVKMLGYTSFQKLAERNLEKEGFEPSFQRKKFLDKIERDGEVIGYPSKWLRQDGNTIYVLESARAIRDSQGKTLYYDGTVEDITERKQLEEGLRQMQKLEGLGTLAGGIAHDFNNILGIILAYITSTIRFKDDAGKLDLAVDTIVKAVERGKTLVQQILTFARKTETEFGPVKVNDVVMEIMTMIFETFPKTLTYAQNIDKDISYINADRSQLHQLLLNLCVNARDAMPNGGLLTINTRMVSVASLHRQHPDAVERSYVCIEVCDTGEGMAPETSRRIFEPFFTTKEPGKGTGLGLAVVFGVVQTHKGFIDVESELGKGTTFSIYLPATHVTEPISVTDEGTLEEIPGGTETLLVVEDEEMLMMTLRMLLVEKGYNVLSAEDGLTALNIYQNKKNDIALVLTDLGLPKMTGQEECVQIKKLNPRARIIVATGYLDSEMKSEFLKAGIQHFLYKPYDLKQVLKVIREVIDEK